MYLGEYDPFEEPPFSGSVGPYPANQTRIWYDPPGVLEFNTKYYWRIVAYDNHGAYTAGPIWFFTTEPNYPPDPAHDPIPPDGANYVPCNATLYWNGSDPNSGDTLRYDVYFGPINPPSYKTTQEENWFKPYDLPLFEDFYWRIVTRDKEGLETSGPIWTFCTDPPCLPTDPEINGPNRGMPDIDYNFTFVSTYIDNSSIKYYIDWGDGDTVETDYHESGEVVTLNHTWNERKTYIIKAKAENIYGEQSGESEHKINIPRNKAVNFSFNLLSWFLERFPLLIKIIYYFFN